MSQTTPTDTDAQRAQAMAGELRVLVGKLKRRLREQAHLQDLTWAQVSVLGRLERQGPATVTALAMAEGVRPQSMGATIAVLKQAGLVEGAPDPADGRQTLLSLTLACRERVAAGRAALDGWLFRAIRAKLSPEEQRELAHGIALLKRLVDM